MTQTLRFPDGFLWGISTSGFQFEGHNHHSQWAAWEMAGGIKTGERSGRACDWWENAEQDFDLARDMGLNALRISVEWSRVEPRPGEWDVAALKRYRAMLQGLRARGILPIVSLHHFSHPQWFEEEGAFLNEDSPNRFSRFVHRVIAELGEFCHRWVTFNEPNVYATMAYIIGDFPPGRAGDLRSVGRAMGNMARAHAKAYRTIHELCPYSTVGWTTNYVTFVPLDPKSPLDRMTTHMQHMLFNLSFDSLLKKGVLPVPLNLWSGDCSIVQGLCDFVGINVYSRAHVKFDIKRAGQMFGTLSVPDNMPQGDRGVDSPFGEAYPQGISRAVENLHYPAMPIYILENGVPDREDRIRPWLIVNAIREVHQMIERGFDIRGYFHWSLVDNFEWAEGWTLRFGLFSLDTITQKRQMRPSGDIYKAIVRDNALTESALISTPANRFQPKDES